MQILIDLSDAQLEAVLNQAKQCGLTSSEVISKAITQNLHLPESGSDDISQYAGLWVRDGKSPRMDALEYQDKLRSEWER